MTCRIGTLVLAVWLVACGADESATRKTPSDDSGADCPYDTSDPCIDSAALEQCQRMYAQCSGQVLVMESCPLQFACPGSGGTSPGGDTPVTDDAESR